MGILVKDQRNDERPTPLEDRWFEPSVLEDRNIGSEEGPTMDVGVLNLEGGSGGRQPQNIMVPSDERAPGLEISNT